MLTPELIAYVRQEMAAGAVDEDLRRALVPHGWSEADVAEALAAAAPREAPAVVHGSRVGQVFISFAFIVASALYAGWAYAKNSQPQQSQGVATLSSATQATTPASAQATAQTPAPAPKPAPAPAPKSTPAQTTVASAQQSGQYKNGTYTGQAANAYYGAVQVQATVSGGKLANVQFLQYPNSHGTSVYINQQAMPMLTQEALQAQGANVNLISGATLTSEAFRQSLASALSQATL